MENGYLVEGSIPLKTLGSLNLIQPGEDKRILTGLFRGEFSHGAGDTIEQRWISWVTPKSEKPDFHIPSAFGHFEISRN